MEVLSYFTLKPNSKVVHMTVGNSDKTSCGKSIPEMVYMINPQKKILCPECEKAHMICRR